MTLSWWKISILELCWPPFSPPSYSVAFLWLTPLVTQALYNLNASCTPPQPSHTWLFCFTIINHPGHNCVLQTPKLVPVSSFYLCTLSRSLYYFLWQDCHTSWLPIALFYCLRGISLDLKLFTISLSVWLLICHLSSYFLLSVYHLCCLTLMLHLIEKIFSKKKLAIFLQLNFCSV